MTPGAKLEIIKDMGYVLPVKAWPLIILIDYRPHQHPIFIQNSPFLLDSPLGADLMTVSQ